MPATRLSEDVLSTLCRQHLATLRWPQLDAICTRGRLTVRLATYRCDHHKEAKALFLNRDGLPLQARPPGTIRIQVRGSLLFDLRVDSLSDFVWRLG